MCSQGDFTSRFERGRPMLGTRFHWLVIVVAGLPALAVGGCSSNQDDVCENVGACTHGGSTDWITSCQDEAKSLQSEASSHGCGGPFDDYYECADSNFTCNGATASFPGCDAKRQALETCISATDANSSCKELTSKTSACAASTVDAGSGDADTGSLAPACTVLRNCQARCYLDHVTNPCVPGLAELSDVVACSSSCPP